MYLILEFAKETKVGNKQDKLLQKEVPNIVLLMNEQLLKTKIQTSENARQKQIAQAQLNDFMFAMFQQSGVSTRLTENIGIQFIDLETSFFQITSDSSVINGSEIEEEEEDEQVSVNDFVSRI